MSLSKIIGLRNIDKKRERERGVRISMGGILMFKVRGHKEEPAEEIAKEQTLRKERDYSI